MTLYILRIDTDIKNFSRLNTLFEISSKQNLKGFWEYKISDEDSFFQNAVEHILTKLEHNLNALKTLGVRKRDLSLWYLYEYDSQCNFEFSSKELKRISLSGLPLCISCWQG
ncbi:MAG: hypothetical protein I8H66_10020 [Sphingobacteriia bacterium]|nr:hypothetical protein [Sphingobacteriia bacterium]